MKIGDLVKVLESHFRNPGMIGIIVDDLNNAGKAFRVLLSNGKIRPKIAKHLELISESR